MAYLRWLGSNWYVFWHSSDAKSKDEEILAVWYTRSKVFPVVPFKELKKVENLEDLKEIVYKYDHSLKELEICEKEWKELMCAVEEWLKNVENEWNNKNPK